MNDARDELAELSRYGWNDFFAAHAAPALAAGKLAARVLRVDRGWLVLVTAAGPARAQQPRSLARGGVVVGDWVTLARRSDSLVIDEVLPRRGALTRRRVGTDTELQVVAANVDLVLVVEGLDRGPNRRRIERVVALAREAGARPLVVLTKADLCPDLPAALAAAADAAPYADVVAVAAGGAGDLAELSAHLVPGATSVLIGPSGSGKSTLVNALLGAERMAVGAVREADHKGRHTTTHRELVVLPSGALLVDTPGVRELGVALEPETMADAFADVVALSDACRFRDCRHDREPGCEVRRAEEDGRLEPGRREGYRKLESEAEALDLRRDPYRAAEARARDKSFARMVRAVTRLKSQD